MGDTIQVRCQLCGHDRANDGNDGYFYCEQCGSQVEDIIQTALDDEDHGLYTAKSLRRRPSAVAATIKPEPISQYESNTMFWESPVPVRNPVKDEWEDGIGPTEPRDFGQSMSQDKEEYNLKLIYLTGLQSMIELQTKALVEKFNVSPLICGIAGNIWLRYLASTEVEDDDWADEVIKESESQKEGFKEDFKPKSKQKGESFNIHGQRALMIWYRSLSKNVPLSHTLVITFLACHLAREAVLPTDILKWSIEGKLPFFTAFMGIEKEFGGSFCPLSCSFMFKPSGTISLYKLESQAVFVARKIGLELPPVNFYAIASRYLKQLSLDSSKILPSVSQIYEWSCPPDLYLSANEMRLPTRVCVLSMVIVAIRIIYDIHGFGYWEKSFSFDLSTGKSLHRSTSSADMKKSSEKPRDVGKAELEAMKLLRHLEERYDELEQTYEHSKNLSNYLQYCKDVVFGGVKSSHENIEEEKLIEDMWKYYLNKKDSLQSSNHGCKCTFPSKPSRDDYVMNSTKRSNKKRERSSHSDDSSQESMNADNEFLQENTSPDDFETSNTVSEQDEAIKRLKLNMKDTRFCYISPRVKVKRRDYLHYVRKKDKGVYTYAAHADYYVLLRSCAKVAKVDVRVMHCAVMVLERRLGWSDKRTGYCLLRLGPEEDICEHCCIEREFDVKDAPVDVLKLRI